MTLHSQKETKKEQRVNGEGNTDEGERIEEKPSTNSFSVLREQEGKLLSLRPREDGAFCGDRRR